MGASEAPAPAEYLPTLVDPPLPDLAFLCAFSTNCRTLNAVTRVNIVPPESEKPLSVPALASRLTADTLQCSLAAASPNE